MFVLTEILGRKTVGVAHDELEGGVRFVQERYQQLLHMHGTNFLYPGSNRPPRQALFLTFQRNIMHPQVANQLIQYCDRE